MQAAKGFELLAEHEESAEHIEKIHQDLKSQNIWVWRSGAIESCLCLEHKESGEWHNYCNKILNTTDIKSILHEPDEIFEFISWLSGIPIYKYIENSQPTNLLNKAA